MRASAALLRFQAATGARIGLRLLIPLLAVAVIAIGMQQYPAQAINRLAASFAGPSPSFVAWALLATIGFGIVSWTRPLLGAVEEGWLVHLPATRSDRRWAHFGGACLVQAPIVVAVTLLVLLETATTGSRALRFLLASPAIAGAAAVVSTLPRRHRRAPEPALERELSAMRLGFPATVFARTAGTSVVEAWGAGALSLAATALFLRNNTLDATAIRLGATLGTGVATTSILAVVGLALTRRRPSWPWARSLPVGSRRRVREDAVLLGATAAPAVIAGALLEPLSGGIVAATLPWLALRAAAAIRGTGPGETRMTVYFAEGAAVSGLIALVPWLSPIALACSPAALVVAARSDRCLK